jgi:hypothetical protein
MLDTIELIGVGCGLLFLLALTARVRWGTFRRTTIVPPRHQTAFRPMNADERLEFEARQILPPRQQPGLGGAPLRDQPLALGNATARVRGDCNVDAISPLARVGMREGLDQQRPQSALVI